MLCHMAVEKGCKGWGSGVYAEWWRGWYVVCGVSEVVLCGDGGVVIGWVVGMMERCYCAS